VGLRDVLFLRDSATLDTLFAHAHRSSLLEETNGSNEVPPFSSCGPHVLFSSQYVRHFSRYSIDLNWFNSLGQVNSFSRYSIGPSLEFL
jgi:hypothetical protein